MYYSLDELQKPTIENALTSTESYKYDLYTAITGQAAIGITRGLAAVDKSLKEKSKREKDFPLKLTDKGIDFLCNTPVPL